MPKTLILVSKNTDDLSFASQLAHCFGATFAHATDVPAALAIADRSEPLALLIDASMDDRFECFKMPSEKTLDSSLVHCLVGQKDLQKMTNLTDAGAIGNIIFRKYEDPALDALRYSKIIQACQSGVFLPLSVVLSPQANIHSIKLQTSTQKKVAVEEVRSQLVAYGCQERISDIIAQATDELLMNAIFDSKQDESGNQTLVGTPRTHDFALEGKHTVECQLGVDENYVGISVTDMFGSLKRTKTLSRMILAYGSTLQVDLDQDRKGAGIGLSLILRSGGSLHFALQPGERTTASVFFKRVRKFTELRNQFQFVTFQISG